MWFRIALLVVLVLLLSAIPVHAATYSFADQGGNMVRLTEEPCPTVSGWMKLNKAEMKYQGKNYEACWLLIGQTVLVFDSAGDVTPIPLGAFKKDEMI